MLKKILIGFFAGIITGLFGAGGRNDTCSGIYTTIKNGRKICKSNINLLYTSTCMCKWIFLFKGFIYRLEDKHALRNTVELSGALIGSKLLRKLSSKSLKTLFTIFLIYVAIRMIIQGI